MRTELREIEQHAQMRDFVLVNIQRILLEYTAKRAQCAGLNVELWHWKVCFSIFWRLFYEFYYRRTVCRGREDILL